MDLVGEPPISIGLFEFEVPVAELVPEESPYRIRRFVVAMVLKGLVGFVDCGIEAAPNPTVRERRARACASILTKQKPGGVPDFVGELAPAKDHFFAQRDVIA